MQRRPRPVYYCMIARQPGQVRRREACGASPTRRVGGAILAVGSAGARGCARHCYLQKDVEDVVFLTMEFAKRVLAHVQLSCSIRTRTQAHGRGSKKMVTFDDMSARELRIYDKGVTAPSTRRTVRVLRCAGDIFIPRSLTSSRSRRAAHFVPCRQTRASAEERVAPAAARGQGAV